MVMPRGTSARSAERNRLSSIEPVAPHQLAALRPLDLVGRIAAVGTARDAELVVEIEVERQAHQVTGGAAVGGGRGGDQQLLADLQPARIVDAAQRLHHRMRLRRVDPRAIEDVAQGIAALDGDLLHLPRISFAQSGLGQARFLGQLGLAAQAALLQRAGRGGRQQEGAPGRRLQAVADRQLGRGPQRRRPGLDPLGWLPCSLRCGPLARGLRNRLDAVGLRCRPLPCRLRGRTARSRLRRGPRFGRLRGSDGPGFLDVRRRRQRDRILRHHGDPGRHRACANADGECDR